MPLLSDYSLVLNGDPVSAERSPKIESYVYSIDHLRCTEPCSERTCVTVLKWALRKAQRQEFRRREERKAEKISTARCDNQELLYRLIKPARRDVETSKLIVNGKTLVTPQDIREGWRAHYQNKVTPKPRPEDTYKDLKYW